MERCPDCNSVMMKTETECGSCGAKVKHDNSGGFKAKFAMLMAVAFYLTLAVTVATFFVPGLPPLSKCLPACVILLMIRSSADQMLDNSSK